MSGQRRPVRFPPHCHERVLSFPALRLKLTLMNLRVLMRAILRNICSHATAHLAVARTLNSGTDLTVEERLAAEATLVESAA